MYPLSPNDVAVGNLAHVPYDLDNYLYYCFADPSYNPESGTDLALNVWQVKREHKTTGTIRILGGGSFSYVATNAATVAALFS